MDDQFNPQQPSQQEAPQAPQYQAPQQPQYQPAPQYQQPQYQAPQYQQPQYQPAPQYQQPVRYQPAEPEKGHNGAGGTGFAFGIVTLILSFFTLGMNYVSGSVFAILALIFAIPGLVCSIVGLAKKNATKALAIIGLIFVLIGIGIVAWRLYAIYAIGSAAYRYYY